MHDRYILTFARVSQTEKMIRKVVIRIPIAWKNVSDTENENRKVARSLCCVVVAGNGNDVPSICAGRRVSVSTGRG